MALARTQSRIVEILVLIGTLGIVPHAPLASQQLGSTFELEDRQAAVGLAIGSTSSSLWPRAGWIRPCTQGAVTSAAAGLFAGGLIGALIGSGNPDWQRLHPRGRSAYAAPSTGRQVILEARDAPPEPDSRALALLRARPGALVNLRFSAGPDLAGYVVRVGFRRVMIAP